MSTDVIMQVIFNGMVIGSQYVLVALGVTLIYGILVIINFAHGDIFMSGAFFAVVMVMSVGMHYLLAGLLTIAFCAALYVLLDRIAFKRLRGFELGPLITSIGAGLFLHNLALVIFGGDPRRLESPFVGQPMTVGPLTFSAQRFLVIPIAFLAIAGLFWFIEKTALGRNVRAVKQDWEVASLMGVNPDRVVLIIIAISGVLVALPAVLVSPLYYVFPLMGIMLTVKAYAIVIMGGFGNVTGTIIAAMLLGVVESFVAAVGFSQWVDSAAFFVLILFLAIRPHGLIPERIQENV
jgi:branched-chain amino acid transport system permease protein